jgi:proteasome lid subunit RPN8/RPN11
MAFRGDQVRQRNAKSGPSPPLQIGRPFPDDHAILWAPVEGLTRSMELAQPAIVITQGALREVIRHLSSAPDQELLGFLIGEQCECPKTKRRFLFITGTLRTGHTIAEDEPVQIPDAEWLGQQLEVRRRRSTLLGWYHSAPFLSPSPSALDMESHRARFTEPWQCGLVVATEGNEPAGGFFRVHPNPAEGGAYVPFFEQVDEEGILEGGRLRTLIDWASYSTSELVERDDDERSVHIPGNGSEEFDAPAAALPLMIPLPAEDAESSPPVRSRWVGATIATVFALGVSFVGVLIWNARRLPEPPVVAEAPHQREPAVAPNSGALAAQRRMDSLASAAVAAANAAIGGTPAQTGDTTAAATTPAGSTPAAPTGAAPATSVAASPPPAPPPAPPADAPSGAPATSAALLRFDSLADSLEHGLQNYHDRRVDFGQKRLSCKELAVGYRAADEALFGLAQIARDKRTLDAQRKARYNQLIAGMDTVNDDFDTSKCQRL